MKKFSLFCTAMMLMGTAAAVEPVDTVKTYELQDVQVVSTRATQKTPMAFSNMQKEQIKQVNYGKDIPSILNMLPSVTISSDAGTGIGYSGIRVRGTDPTRINVTTNGIPMNDAESSQMYWVNIGDFTSSVQSIQVQRGVGTSTNGAGAFGATVNMQTENIGAKPYLGLDISGGSYGTHKETLRFSTGLLGNHWGIQGRLSNIGSDGYIDRASSAMYSYFLQGGYFTDKTVVKLITFNGKERTYMAWDYASKADMEKYGRKYNPCGMYTDDDGNTAFYKDQTDNYHQQYYQLLWNQLLNRNWNLNVGLYYTRGDGYYQQYKTDQKLYKYHLESLGKRSDLTRKKKMGNDFYGTVAAVNFDNHNGLTANIGGGINKYDGVHYGKVLWLRDFIDADITNNEYYRNHAHKVDGNIYGKVNYDILPGLNGFVDLQYRHVSLEMYGPSQEYDDNKQQIPLDVDRTYNFFNPKAGLTWQFMTNHTAYASYAIAHKEPVRNDFEDMISETEQVDPKAERLNDLEIGYRYETAKLSAGANFYYMDYDNQFVLTGAQDSNGEMVARNIKDTYRMGVELTLGWRPCKGFTWDMNATFSKNRAKNMNVTVINEDWSQSTANVGTTHLAYSPDIIVNNCFAYEWKGFKAMLTSKYISEQYMTNSGFKNYLEDDGSYTSAMIDAMFVTDIDLSYTFKLKALKSATIGITVYNLFSEKYESNGSCSMNFRNENGKVIAYNGGWAWATYSAQAPAHFLAHLSLNF